MTTPAPPTPVERSFRLWIAAVVVGVLGSALSFATMPAAPGATAAAGTIVGAIIGLLFLGAIVYCALRLRRGENWARIALTVLGGISAVFTVLGVLLTAGLGVNLGLLSTTVSLLQAALIVAAILFSFQAPANAYFR
ncbi:hypothetical protein [Actinomycetospora cinnamomea]|uniref:hypothetical protein n=1 Tax=Actinomycetospora cinnamomea TaxID=663609 RepID=UPI001057AD52|nr:hypothetical protein [Actinomycetospora cinnamomea]